MQAERHACTLQTLNILNPTFLPLKDIFPHGEENVREAFQERCGQDCLVTVRLRSLMRGLVASTMNLEYTFIKLQYIIS